MKLFGLLFFINIVILLGLTAYRCFKKQKKAIVFNIIILILFILIKVVQTNYVAIKTGLLEILGQESFLSLKSILSKILFFSSSVTIGIQIVCELIGIIIFVVFTTKTALLVITKCIKGVFYNRISPDNERVVDKHDKPECKNLYILCKLLN